MNKYNCTPLHKVTYQSADSDHDHSAAPCLAGHYLCRLCTDNNNDGSVSLCPQRLVFSYTIYSNSGQTVVEVITVDPIQGTPTTSTMYVKPWLGSLEFLT